MGVSNHELLGAQLPHAFARSALVQAVAEAAQESCLWDGRSYGLGTNAATAGGWTRWGLGELVTAEVQQVCTVLASNCERAPPLHQLGRAGVTGASSIPHEVLAVRSLSERTSTTKGLHYGLAAGQHYIIDDEGE